MQEQETHSVRYFLIGAVLGAVGGLLLAQKPGTELQEDLKDYGERGRGLVKKLLDRIPFKVKAAGVIGGVRGAGGEAFREARENVQESIG